MTNVQETIARWGRGEDPPQDELVELGRVAEERPGVLDGDLQQLTGIRSRALVRRLRELAAEGIAGHEPLSELADRIEELPDRFVVSPERERRLLAHLLAVGPQTDRQLAEALSDEDVERIAQWADDAADRGLIEQVEPGSPLRRWHVTDRGRAVLGVPGAL